MATSEDDETENFLRASLLLLKGGRLVSVETLNREVRASGKTLDALLKENEGKLRHKLSKHQIRKLFPDSGGTCVDQWDLAMLITVLLTVFKRSLSDDELKALKSIKYKRDTVYAHTPTSAIPFDEYDDIRSELETALYSLSNSLGDNVKAECPKIVQQCTKEPLSSSSNAELMKQLNDTDSLVKAVAKALQDTHAFLVEMKKEIIDKLKQMSTHEDKATKIIKVIYTELSLSGDVNESDDIDFVDNIVTTVINKAIEKVGNKDDYPKIRRVVENILKEVESIPDVKILPAEHKCILLKFQCSTYASILDVLTYLDSNIFKESLTELASSLSSTLPDMGSSFRIDATIPTGCFRELLDELRAEKSSKYTRTVQLRTEVQTIPGIQHIWSLFENGGATNSLNQLSEAVSDELHTNITITSSVNVEQVLEAINESETVQTNKSKEDSLVAAVDDDSSTSEQHQSETSDTETNALYRSLILERSLTLEGVSSAADSGVGETASIISQSHHTDAFSDLSDDDRNVPSLGELVLMKGTKHERYSTVGPIVTVPGFEEKCFITVGDPSEDIHYSVSGIDMKVLARSNFGGVILLAPRSTLQEDVEKKGDTVSVCYYTDKRLRRDELAGEFVWKLGAITGRTAGIIASDDTYLPEHLVLLITELDYQFASSGDGGAMVYMPTSDGFLNCIGVLIGTTIKDSRECYFAAKRIEGILLEFGEYLGKPVTLDYTTMSEQIKFVEGLRFEPPNADLHSEEDSYPSSLFDKF